MKFRIVIAQFPYGHILDDRMAAWVYKLIPKLEADKRIDAYAVWSKADTPITMQRNLCLKEAKEWGADLVLFLDNDNIPDYHSGEEDQKPFWDLAFEFWIKHNTEGCVDPISREKSYGPCIIAAPYCGPPPNECVYVFDWHNFSGRTSEPDFALEMVPRHEAALRRDVCRAAALCTGVMLIDMRAIDKLPHPHTYYEWKDKTQSQKASTEDVTFTRDLADMGIPLWATWNSWAGHIKQVVVPRARNLSPTLIPKHLANGASLCRELGIPIPEKKYDPVRPVNTYKKLPINFPASLVRQRAEPAQKDEAPTVPEPPAELQAELARVESNGDGA